MHLKLVGTTIFNNKSKSVNASDMNLETLVVSAVASALKAKGNFIVKLSDSQDFQQKVHDINQYQNTTLWKISAQKELIKEISKRNGTELVVIVNHVLYTDVIYHTSELIEGFGIYQRSLAGINKAVNYITLRVLVYNGLSGEEITYASRLVHQPRPASGWSGDLQFESDDINETKKAIVSMYKNLTNELLKEIGLK